MDRLADLLAAAEVVVSEAAQTLVNMQGGPLRTERKDFLDIVTEADLAAEKIVVEGLRKLTPEVGFLAEEGGASGAAPAACASSFPGRSRWHSWHLGGSTGSCRSRPTWFRMRRRCNSSRPAAADARRRQENPAASRTSRKSRRTA